MNGSHDSVIVPSLHDTLTDARRGGAGFADEKTDDAFPRHDTDDPKYVADMQAIEATRPAGYVDALCMGCRCPLFVAAEQCCGDVQCAQCQCTGKFQAAAEDDNHPRPPTSGVLRPEVQRWADFARRLSDDMLLSGIGLADTDPLSLCLTTREDLDAFIYALSAEVARRLDGQNPEERRKVA